VSENYEFRVHGRCSPLLREAVAEFSDVHVEPAPPETLIYGTIADQAHLHGLLMLLEDLGLRIVSLHRVPGPPENSDRGD